MDDRTLPGIALIESTEPHPVVSFSLLQASKIGRYSILRPLGRGGFGQVLLGYDEDLDRPVAIKVPNPERISAPGDIEAFLNEARILARLDHPHIVPVYDVGRTEDGLCFVVSKLVDGSDLSVKIEQARPSFQESAELTASVAEALHYAHTRGLVHRDIKPANILIDAAGKPCVADFGLALKDEDFGKVPKLAGTPAYMSPEQARGEGHRVDGRSDIFSLGVVFYELLTGRRPFRGDSHQAVMEQVVSADVRPPRQIVESIPKELERICLKALSKRASERYTTGSDLAEDLRLFLGATGGTVSPPATPAQGSMPLGSTQEVTPLPTTPRPTDSDQQPIKVVPKGLRSFDEHDADFFLELLPGPRDRNGLPESLRFWKSRIEKTDPDRTFRVGLIYGPSGCGKSSLVKAGLIPRLTKHVLPVYVEATAEETEARLLRGICKACPDLLIGLGLIDSLAALRRGRVLRSSEKMLLVVNQFEQWLHARRGEENTELVAALRHCDGEHLQAVVMVRDDFWMAATRFMKELEIELQPDHNIAAVDLFYPRHARKVLRAFGQAYGTLARGAGDLSRDQDAFLDQAVAGLTQDGKVISVRLALFAEMVMGKPWTPASLREVGGTEGVGATFLEETFSSSQANPRHRLHQQAAQAVLKGLLPGTGTDIKGQMRSEAELQEVSGYHGRTRDFAELIHILDGELRLITPTDPEGSTSEGQPAAPGGRYYQLTHDYLVHSLRDWLTRKQRETRRGRAELRLAERSALWSAKPENSLLPPAWEWVATRLLTTRKDWTVPQRRMMKRASTVHALRGLGLVILAALGSWGAIEVYGNLRASAVVESLKTAGTSEVPALIEQLSGYRHWANSRLIRLLGEYEKPKREHLHASLALLPVDASQVEYLSNRLLNATPSEFPVLRDALQTHRSDLIPKLWTLLDTAKAGDIGLLPAASALAVYDPENARWETADGKVAEALMTVNSLMVGPWLEALRPVRGKLTAPLSAIFRDKRQSETVHSLATAILADYASDDSGLLAELLMVSEPKAYVSLFPVAERQAAKILPVLQAELSRKAAYLWDDPPLDPSWTKPDTALVRQIETAQGLLRERFAFCQTMPLNDFLSIAEGLRGSGYRPVRYRPYADGPAVVVAASWTRDGRSWRMDSGLTVEQARQQDEKNRSARFLPVNVAGYLASDTDEKAAERYAALWVEETGDDDSRLYIGKSAHELTEVQERFKDVKLIPRTLHALCGSDGRMKYSGVWGRPPRAEVRGRESRDQFEADFERNRLELGDESLLDVTVSKASHPQRLAERLRTALATANQQLYSRSEALFARSDRAMAYLGLGEIQKAIEDLNMVIGKDPDAAIAIQCRASRTIAYSRLGNKNEALSDLAKLQTADVAESTKYLLTAAVAVELGFRADETLASLEEALRKQPKDADLRYDAARAFALASKAISRSDTAKGHLLAKRSLQLLRESVRDNKADFGRMDEDADFDLIRGDQAFAEIMKAGHPDRRYAAVWTSDPTFEAMPIYGRDPASHLQTCRELITQGYCPVSCSVARTTPGGPLLSASVWHRPVVAEEVKDQLAERQARAAVALVRLGKAEQVWPLMRHSADPRLRSFILNWLSPMGTDHRAVVAELDRLPFVVKPVQSEGQKVMDAILFHRETSVQRALILALGTYGMLGLSLGDRDPLTKLLFDVYRNDPDSGIHGAVEWTLRKWGQQEQIKAIDAGLMTAKAWGDRRWFVNGQGQTYAVINGPLEFSIGSPPTELERLAASERPRRFVIPYRFAVAAKEVTVEQYSRFSRSHTQFEVSQDMLDAFSSGPRGPVIDATWYGAVAYCNWLSEHEGLPKDQWCYVPAERGGYSEGMTIPADVLQRTGYRLPTDEEWEYACRAGTLTSRYYGHSTGLLGSYAWHQVNSQERAWPVGSLLPNDLGLFDLLGNTYEWIQQGWDASQTTEFKGKTSHDYIRKPSFIFQGSVRDKDHRCLRGGSWSYRAAGARSAKQISDTPASQNPAFGFRPVRTLPSRP